MTSLDDTGAELVEYGTRDAADAASADLAAACLRNALDARGRASFLTSGGTTPSGLLSRLSAEKLDWDGVEIGLVDDRFVPPDHDASNEGLVRRALLQDRARHASFTPMWSETSDPADAAAIAANAYEKLIPADFVLLGMGNDGHTASWFPGALNLGDALAEDASPVVSIDATGCPVAGEFTQRLTLSRPALATARQAVLLIYGDEKRAALEAALQSPGAGAPVSLAVTDLANRLRIVWAP